MYFSVQIILTKKIVEKNDNLTSQKTLYDKNMKIPQAPYKHKNIKLYTYALTQCSINNAIR